MYEITFSMILHLGFKKKSSLCLNTITYKLLVMISTSDSQPGVREQVTGCTPKFKISSK
jgi:hypothetical protein